MKLVCPPCATGSELLDGPAYRVVRGTLRPRPGVEHTYVNGVRAATWAPTEYVCDLCGDRMEVGKQAAAVTSVRNRSPEWWRAYLEVGKT